MKNFYETDETHKARVGEQKKMMKKIKKENKFKYKCICLWSKDDKYGFIPNTECPVHGKETKKMLSKCVDINLK